MELQWQAFKNEANDTKIFLGRFPGKLKLSNFPNANPLTKNDWQKMDTPREVV